MLLSVDIDEAGYDADSLALRDIHFSVGPGELVGLIGPNGAGKSSTIKAIHALFHFMALQRDIFKAMDQR